MTINQLNCFLAAVNEKSYTRAANSLYISQPAISKSIAKLESELGFELLRRLDDQLVPTEAGRRYYDFITKTWTEHASLLEEIRTLLSAPLVDLRVGCPNTWEPAFLYREITCGFERDFPGLRFTFESRRLQELISLLEAERLDIILTHDFFSPPGRGVISERVGETNCGVVCSPEVFRRLKKPEDLAEYEFFVFDGQLDKRFGGVLARICAEYGFRPRTKYIENLDAALYEIARSSGVMLFSDWDGAARNPAFCFFPLTRKLPLHVLYKEDRISRTGMELIRRMQEQGAGLPKKSE